MANLYKSLADIGAGMNSTSSAPTTQINNEQGTYVYDGDTSYTNGVGQRAAYIDAPELNKTDRLLAAKNAKIERLSAGDHAAVEASILNQNNNITGENLKKDYFGRNVVHNPEFEKTMVSTGYAVPAFLEGNENAAEYITAMNRSKSEGKGLWADNAYSQEMRDIVNKRILNDGKLPSELRNVAEYVNYDGTATVEDYEKYAKVKDKSNMIDAIQSYFIRQTAPIVGMASNLGDTEAGKARVKYLQENADILAGYDTEDIGEPEKIRRAMASGVENVANKVVGLVGEGIESIGEGIIGIKNLENNFLKKEQERLDKYYKGEKIADWRMNLMDTLKVGEVGSWLKDIGTGIQKDTVEFTKDNTGAKLVGYDTTDINELTQDIDMTIKQEGFIPAIGKAITDVRSLQVLSQSIPEMMALAASVGTMALVNVNNNINIGEAELGRPMTSQEKTLSAAASIFGTYLDRAGDKLALSGMNPAKQAAREVIENAPAGVKKYLANKYGKAILKIGEAPVRIAGAMAVEGVTEYGQTLAETAAQTPDVFREGFVQAELDEANVAGVLGTAMGGQIATPAVASSVIGSMPKSGDKPKEEEPELVQKSDESQLNRAKAFSVDTSTILGSTASDVEKMRQVREAITTLVENDLLSKDVVDNITTSVKAFLPDTDVNELVETGRDIGVIKKSANDVSKEASEGPRGFLTYYENAVTAKDAGDDKKFEANVMKIENFLASQKAKMETFKAVERNILAEYTEQANIKGITLDELYQQVKDDNTRYSYTYGVDNRKADVKKKAVLEKHLSGDPLFKGDAYKYINMLENEVNAMTRLHNKLIGATEEVEPVEATVTLAEKTKAGIRNKYEKTNDISAVIEAINRSKGTEAQKSAAIEYAKGLVVETPVSTPVVEEVTEVVSEPVNKVPVMPDNLKAFIEKEMAKVSTQAEKDSLLRRVTNSTNESVKPFIPQLQSMVEGIEIKAEPVKAEPVAKVQTKQDIEDKISKIASERDAIEETYNSMNPNTKEAKALDKQMDEMDDEITQLYRDIEELDREAELETLKKEREALEKEHEKLSPKSEKAPEVVVEETPPVVDDEVEAVVEEPVAEVTKGLTVKDIRQLYQEIDDLNAVREEAVAKGDNELVSTIEAEIASKEKKLDKANNIVYNEIKDTIIAGQGISGTKKASVVFESSKLTGLSALDTIDASKEVKALSEVLVEPTLTKDGKLAKTYADTPAVALIYNEDGSINERTAVAISIAADNYVSGLFETLNRMDVDEFKTRFGNVNIHAPDVVNKFGYKATPLRFEVETIGADVLSNLGLKVKSNVSMTYEQGLKADLGMTVMALLEKKKAVIIAPIDSSAKLSPLAVGLGVAIDPEFSNMKALEYENKYGIEASGARTYSLEKPKQSRKVRVHHQELTDITAEQAELINAQEAMAYSLNKGYGVLREVYKTDVELKKALGQGKRWKSRYKRVAQKSIDREIDNSVDSLRNLSRLETADGGSKPIWFRWFLSKNGRFNLDSTTVNPQTDKLHRFLVTAESAKSSINADTVADIMSTESKSDIALGFKYAVVQAFDGVSSIDVPAIDKKSRKIVEEAANSIISMPDSELLELISELGSKGKGHIGHAAIAVSAIRELKKGKPFVTELTLEFDGLTNGFAFRTMQFPLDGFKEWLPRIGVVVQESDRYEDIQSVAEMKNDGLLDTYEILGGYTRFPSIEESFGTDSAIALVSQVEGALPNLNNRKEIRNLLKSPVMVFNYGAGRDSIIKAITEDLLIEAVEVLAGDYNAMKKLGLTRDMLRDNPLSSPELAWFANELSHQISQVYAEPIATALETTFSETVELNKSMNAAFSLMYKEMKKEVARRVKEKSNGAFLPSKAEMDGIYKDVLKEYGPIIKGPTSGSIQEGILVATRAAEDVDALVTNSPKTVKSTAKFAEGQRQVGLIVRGIGEPGAAGSVLPIHTADGTVQGRAIKNTEGGYLGIHDAQVVGLNQLSSAKDYNEEWYNTNKEYSVLANVISALKKLPSSMDKVTLVSKLEKLQAKVDANRAQLFNTDMKVGQMVGLPGSMYEVKVKESSDIIPDTAPVLDAQEEVVEQPIKKNIFKTSKVEGKVAGEILKNTKDCGR